MSCFILCYVSLTNMLLSFYLFICAGGGDSKNYQKLLKTFLATTEKSLIQSRYLSILLYIK